MSLVRDGPAGHHFDSTQLGWLTCASYPYATDDTVCLVGDWFAWYFVFDDVLDGTPEGIDVDYTTNVIEALAAVFTTPTVENCRQALGDLWRRTAAGKPHTWRHRYTRDFIAYLAAHRRQAEINRVAVPPDEDTYIPMRLHAGAMWACEDMIEAVTGQLVDDELLANPDLHTTRQAAGNLVLWANDLWSAHKELSTGDVCNYLAVLSHHRGITVTEAVPVLVDRIAQETHRFLAAEDRIRSHLLPRLPALQRHAVESLVDGLAVWPAGNTGWAAISTRYR